MKPARILTILALLLPLACPAAENLRSLLSDFDDLFHPVSQRQIYVAMSFDDGTKSNVVVLEGGLGLVKMKSGRLFGVSAREAPGDAIDLRVVEFLRSDENGGYDTLRLHRRLTVKPGERTEVLPGKLALAASWGH